MQASIPPAFLLQLRPKRVRVGGGPFVVCDIMEDPSKWPLAAHNQPIHLEKRPAWGRIPGYVIL
jgi:hypothetical protein